jgi:hypothetical protein
MLYKKRKLRYEAEIARLKSMNSELNEDMMSLLGENGLMKEKVTKDMWLEDIKAGAPIWFGTASKEKVLGGLFPFLNFANPKSSFPETRKVPHVSEVLPEDMYQSFYAIKKAIFIKENVGVFIYFKTSHGRYKAITQKNEESNDLEFKVIEANQMCLPKIK